MARNPVQLQKGLSLADFYGGARLATDAVGGVTDLVEAVHATVARPFGRPHRARGIAGGVYRAVRATAAGVGRGLALAWAAGRARRGSGPPNAPDKVM